jgi:hypothetical protein
LDVSGFAVPALHTGGGEWISPHVLDMLHVLGVSLQLFHQAVVISVRLVAERFIAFQDDHRGAVGVRLVERSADPLRGNHRRRILRRHCHRVVPRDRLYGRHKHVQGDGQQQPCHQDRHREPANKPHEFRASLAVGVFGAHAAFTRQEV